MPSEAETCLLLAKQYIDSIESDGMQYYGILSYLSKSAKHLDRARQLDPKCSIETTDKKTKTTTTHTLDDLCALALYYEGLGFNYNEAPIPETQQAVKAFETALAFWPNSPSVHTELARALLRLSRNDEARRHISEALRLDPQYIPAHQLQDGHERPKRAEGGFKETFFGMLTVPIRRWEDDDMRVTRPLPSELFQKPAFDPWDEYRRVKAIYDTYPLKIEDKTVCDEHTSKLIEGITNVIQSVPSKAFLDNVYSTIHRLYELEEVYASRPSEPFNDSNAYRQYLGRKTEGLSVDRIRAADKAVLDFFHKVLTTYAPAAVFGEQPHSTTEIPFIQLARTPDWLMHALYSFDDTEYENTKLFDNLDRQLFANVLSVSGYTWEDFDKNKAKKLIYPWDSKLPLPDRCTQYLRDSPFLELFLMPLPFDIPMVTRFEHHWIVAPPKAGKSTTLQYLIMRDLELVAANKASIVVMESQRDLFKAIEGLKLFAPGQRLDGKLVTIDVEDVERPVALNLFDTGMDETRSYSPAEREAFRNAALASYEYIFGDLLTTEFTSRQNTLFAFTLELLLTIPGATLDTFVDLMEPDGISKFQDYLPRLVNPDARRFFELKFNKGLDTKEQVLDRLFALKRNQTLARMFSARKSKFDFFTEMGKAKVILFNVSQSMLQQTGVELVGRFFISMVLLAAHRRQTLPERDRLPCFVYIDECQNFIKRDTKIPDILDQARKLRVGLILAHQRLEQLEDFVLKALYGSTSIKFASKVSDADAHALNRDMRTTPEFIMNQPPYHFAAYVRDLTDTAVSISIPYINMNEMPRMTAEEQRIVRRAIRDRYGIDRAASQPEKPAPNAESFVQPASRPVPPSAPPKRSFSPDDWES